MSHFWNIYVSAWRATTLKLETIHFDIDINFLGETCKCLEDNTISDSFSKLKKLYFFLVNYVMKSPEQKFLVHLPPVLWVSQVQG